MTVKTTDVPDAEPARDRSEELLDAACRVIAVTGARRLSLRDVAAEAGVSKALLHYYFSTRNELLARAYEYADRRSRQRVWQEVAPLESGTVRLCKVLGQYLSEDEQVAADWLLWSELSSTAMFEPELRPAMESSFEQWTEWIESLVRDAISEGTVPSDQDPKQITLRLTAMTEGLGLLCARQLVDRNAASAALGGYLAAELDGADHAAGEADGRASPPATGYLRLLAGLTRTAVQELRSLSTSAAEERAIETVCDLLDARTVAAGVVNAPGASGSTRRGAPGTEYILHGRAVDNVPTPALIVDGARLERNLERFANGVRAAGAALRPHVKAHKTVVLGLRQLGHGAVGLAAAKPTEGEVFWRAGCRDLVIAFPTVGPDKWERLAHMAREGHVAVHVESRQAAEGLSAAAVRAGSTIGVQLELDTGLGRSGLSLSDLEGVISLAELAAGLPGLELEGIVSYRGVRFAPAVDRDQAADEEGELMVDVAAQLRRAGFPVATVATGSTATALRVASAAGVTEVRAGAYLFMDGAQLAAGTAGPDDVALTVLATVVSVSGAGRVTIDAGSKTFSANGPAIDGAFAVSADGRVRITGLSEEHGVGVQVDGAPVHIGERMAFVPSFASSVVGLGDELIVVHDGRVEEVWPVAARGLRT
jgi:D-serine deaminase-like pyridoxal phosphate-dependent protein/DNA-binding transcriptional regulator YbjK